MRKDHPELEKANPFAVPAGTPGIFDHKTQGNFPIANVAPV
jgi:hypothetical protein